MQALSKAASDFDRDPRRRQEIRLRPYADEIYRATLKATKIARAEQTGMDVLDIQLGIDVTLTLPNGMIMTGQEKFLSREYAHYATATVEYEQNQFTHELGDWGKLACQFYFTGYESDNGFSPWILLNWPAVVIATNNGLIQWRDNANKNGHARASFKIADMAGFPLYCVLDGRY